MEKISNYLDYLYLAEELEVYQEGIGDIVKNYTADKVKKMLARMSNFVETKNFKGMRSLLNTTGLTKVKLPTIDSYMSSKYKEYTTVKTLANRVLKNSLRGRHDKKLLEVASVFLAIRTFMPERKGAVAKPKKDSKTRIKEFVSKYNSYYDDYEEKQERSESKMQIPKESIPDYILGITIILSIVGLISFGVWFIYSHLTLIVLIMALAAIVLVITSFFSAAAAAGGGGH